MVVVVVVVVHCHREAEGLQQAPAPQATNPRRVPRPAITKTITNEKI